MSNAAQNPDASLIGPDITGIEQFQIPNIAVDEGLSAPFNAFTTFFGQFFDHGLSLIDKGGNGLVYIPLQEDDPLFEPSSNSNFMLMTRASLDAGLDGLIGTDGDVSAPINATTPHVDQQQTYSSHASSHFLLRHYEVRDARLQSSGRLLDGFGNDRRLDTADWRSGRQSGFTEVLDLRPAGTRLGGDGRNLLRNIERLQFSDQSVVIDQVAPINSPAQGQPRIGGTAEVSKRLNANIALVRDAENITASNPTGEVTTDVDWIWEVENVLLSNVFTPILRVSQADDAVIASGRTLVLSAAEAGLRVRVVGLFQDDASVFEWVASQPVLVAGTPVAPATPALNLICRHVCPP